MILKNYQYNVWLITCMFTLALKAESVNVMGFNVFTIFFFQEIYPPKLSEFAYVTDGACTENEILDEELLMLKVSHQSLCL